MPRLSLQTKFLLIQLMAIDRLPSNGTARTSQCLQLIFRHVVSGFSAQACNRAKIAAEFLEADIGFHMAIGQASHNAILLKALLLIRNLMQRWIGGALAVTGVQEKALLQHKAVFEALAARDAAEARVAMTAHLDEMAGHLDEEVHEALPMGEAMGFPGEATGPGVPITR